MRDQPTSYSNDLNGFSRLLCLAVTRMLRDKGGVELSRDPLVREKEAVSFQQRLRVDGLEKFNARTVFAAVKFYLDAHQMEMDRPAGALVVFVEVEQLSRLLWSLEYPRIDDDDEAAILDGCGTLTNLIAGHFVKEIYDRGYVHLEMSHFESYINTAVNGIAFNPQEPKKSEIIFWIGGQKRMVAELTMMPLPKVS